MDTEISFYEYLNTRKRITDKDDRLEFFDYIHDIGFDQQKASLFFWSQLYDYYHGDPLPFTPLFRIPFEELIL